MKMRTKWQLMAVLGLGTPCMLSQMHLSTSQAGELAKRHNMPPAARVAEPGPMVGGPGPGVLMPETIPVPGYGAVAPTIQILFNQPQAMNILYDVVGDGHFGSDPLVVPGRLEFAQGGIYRLKLTDIPGREGVELYPTVEVGTASYRTAAYLAHNALAIQFTEDDLDQALSGNFVTKVIYLPDPEFQGEAISGIDTLVSNRLEPGLDPIVEADRRGSILAIVRLGNKDVELSSASGTGALPYAGMPMLDANGMPCGPNGGMMAGPYSNPPNMVAGVTAPQYGMTYSGTPIGLPGPPHIPLGHPAGLQQHVMKNHTHMHIPDPVDKMKIHVRHQPGYSWPQPPSRAHIKEQNIHPGFPSGAPGFYHASRVVAPNQFGGPTGGGPAPGGAAGGAPGEYCPPGQVR
ncbi:MAG: hypothetical protein KGQ60_13170 [Planctomycetes bacterium]|nr:hypothetical protein [Planctomycetota bacterium]